jgi:hypothetical protein
MVDQFIPQNFGKLKFDNPDTANCVFVFKKGTLNERKIFVTKELLLNVEGTDYFKDSEPIIAPLSYIPSYTLKTRQCSSPDLTSLPLSQN